MQSAQRTARPLFLLLAMNLLGACNCNSATIVPDGGTINAYDCHCSCSSGAISKGQDVSVCLSSPMAVPLAANGTPDLVALKATLAADCDTRVCKGAAEALGNLVEGAPFGCITCSGSIPVVHTFNVPSCNSCTTVACSADQSNSCPQTTIDGTPAGTVMAPMGAGKCCNVVTSDPSMTGCGSKGIMIPSTQVCMAASADPLGTIPQTGLFAWQASQRSAGTIDASTSTLTLVPNNDSSKAVSSTVSGELDFVGRPGGSYAVSSRLVADSPVLSLDVGVPVNIGATVEVGYTVQLSSLSLLTTSSEGCFTPDATGSGTIGASEVVGWLHGHVKVSSGTPFAPNQGESDMTFKVTPSSDITAGLDPTTGEFIFSGSISVAEDASNNIPSFSGSLTLRGTLSNRPPQANAGANQTVECAPAAGENVTLDGSRSSDVDNNLVQYTWHRGGTAFDPVVASTPTASVHQDIGTQTYELVVSDSDSQTDEAQVTVTVQWTQPPTVDGVQINANCDEDGRHRFDGYSGGHDEEGDEGQDLLFQLGQQIVVSAHGSCGPISATYIKAVDVCPKEAGGSGGLLASLSSSCKQVSSCDPSAHSGNGDHYNEHRGDEEPYGAGDCDLVFGSAAVCVPANYSSQETIILTVAVVDSAGHETDAFVQLPGQRDDDRNGECNQSTKHCTGPGPVSVSPNNPLCATNVPGEVATEADAGSAAWPTHPHHPDGCITVPGTAIAWACLSLLSLARTRRRR